MAYRETPEQFAGRTEKRKAFVAACNAPSAPSSTAPLTPPGRIPDLEGARSNAEYWRNGAKDESLPLGERLMALDQAVNAWKNAAYAMADQRDAATRSAINAPVSHAIHDAILEAAAIEVDSHWNHIDTEVNQKAQAERSAAAIRKMKFSRADGKNNGR